MHSGKSGIFSAHFRLKVFNMSYHSIIQAALQVLPLKSYFPRIGNAPIWHPISQNLVCLHGNQTFHVYKADITTHMTIDVINLDCRIRHFTYRRCHALYHLRYLLSPFERWKKWLLVWTTLNDSCFLHSSGPWEKNLDCLLSPLLSFKSGRE